MSEIFGRSLALVIPVHNDAAGLARLLDQARALGVFDQIIVVDDGSRPRLPRHQGVQLLRNPLARGGGRARNRGLRAVRCDYVLFFDADDELTHELTRLLADLKDWSATRPFDLCLFKHADTRVGAEGLWGQPDWDERFWQAAGLGPTPLAEIGPAAVKHLVQTANYPWNKILRTEFLRQHGIGCAATTVHQDIPLHWLSFLKAETLLASDRVCALHHVRPGAGRLTNRRGRERFGVFEALDPVAFALRRDPDWRDVLTGFAEGLFTWIKTLIRPELKAEFTAAAAQWLLRHGFVGSPRTTQSATGQSATGQPSTGQPAPPLPSPPVQEPGA